MGVFSGVFISPCYLIPMAMASRRPIRTTATRTVGGDINEPHGLSIEIWMCSRTTLRIATKTNFWMVPGGPPEPTIWTQMLVGWIHISGKVIKIDSILRLGNSNWRTSAFSSPESCCTDKNITGWATKIVKGSTVVFPTKQERISLRRAGRIWSFLVRERRIRVAGDGCRSYEVDGGKIWSVWIVTRRLTWRLAMVALFWRLTSHWN